MKIVRVTCLHRDGWDAEPEELMVRRVGATRPDRNTVRREFMNGTTLDRMRILADAGQRASEALRNMSRGHWIGPDGRVADDLEELERLVDAGVSVEAAHQLRCSKCGETLRASEAEIQRMLAAAAASGVAQLPPDASSGIVVSIA